MVVTSLLYSQKLICTYTVDLAAKVMSGGKFEQVYSFEEPTYVPLVYILAIKIFECPSIHFNTENDHEVFTVC